MVRNPKFQNSNHCLMGPEGFFGEWFEMAHLMTRGALSSADLSSHVYMEWPCVMPRSQLGRIVLYNYVWFHFLQELYLEDFLTEGTQSFFSGAKLSGHVHMEGCCVILRSQFGRIILHTSSWWHFTQEPYTLRSNWSNGPCRNWHPRFQAIFRFSVFWLVCHIDNSVFIPHTAMKKFTNLFEMKISSGMSYLFWECILKTLQTAINHLLVSPVNHVYMSLCRKTVMSQLSPAWH